MKTSQETLNEEIESLILRMEERATELTGESRLFKEMTLSKDRLTPSELGMLRCTSWAYVLFHEVGKVNVDFLVERLPIYGLDEDSDGPNHIQLVHRLRTYFQHNLDLKSARDLALYNDCLAWFKSACGSNNPEAEAEWKQCLVAYLEATSHLLTALDDCLVHISHDELRPQILQEWKSRHDRRIEPHAFDALIAEVASDLGREAINPVKVRKRYIESWTRELDSLAYNFDFEREARKLIERALLHDIAGLLPITGQDILDYFGDVQPGPVVGQLLKAARTLYENHPCNRQELLQKLAQYRDKDG